LNMTLTEKRYYPIADRGGNKIQKGT
jgi:hypothetical protein